MIQFEVGKTYTCVDTETWSTTYTVVKRSAKTVTVTPSSDWNSHDSNPRSFRVKLLGNAETFKPRGNYSGSPTVDATYLLQDHQVATEIDALPSLAADVNEDYYAAHETFSDAEVCFSDAPGDNSHPEQDIPDDLITDSAAASDATLADSALHPDNTSMDDWRNAILEARARITRFTPGHVYYSNAGLPYTVIKRSQKFITLTDRDGNSSRKLIIDWVSNGLNTGHVPDAEFVILNSRKGHKLYADAVPCPFCTVVPHENIPMPTATDTIKLLTPFQWRNVSNRIEYKKGESFLGTFTFNYFDSDKKSALFIVTLYDNGPDYSVHGTKFFKLYEDFSFEHKSTVAVYAPRSETFQTTNNSYNDFKTGKLGSLEEQFRRALPQFLTAAGIMDNNGYIIPDGYETERVYDALEWYKSKWPPFARCPFQSFGIIIPGLSDSNKSPDIRDFPAYWNDSHFKFQAVRVYLRLLGELLRINYHANIHDKEINNKDSKLALSLIDELHRLFDAQKPSVRNDDIDESFSDAPGDNSDGFADDTTAYEEGFLAMWDFRGTRNEHAPDFSDQLFAGISGSVLSAVEDVSHARVYSLMPSTCEAWKTVKGNVIICAAPEMTLAMSFRANSTTFFILSQAAEHVLATLSQMPERKSLMPVKT